MEIRSSRVGAGAGVLFGFLISLLASPAVAMPTSSEVYRNDDLGVVVYKDSERSDVFWYLPLVRLYTVDGVTQYVKRERANGAVDFTFYLLPEFPKDVMDLLALEVPGLRNRQQLRAVPARKFGIQVPHYSVAALSDDVTDYRYLNAPQMVRLSLSKEDAADFELLFKSAPGVPANLVISYDSEKVEKFLKIELSYNEVYRAMDIQASGHYTFTKAEIEAGISKYLANKYLAIRSKGDLKMPEIVEKVISECFTPVVKPTPKPNSLDRSPREGDPAVEAVLSSRSRMESALRDWNFPDTTDFPSEGGRSEATSDASVQFQFKANLADRTDRFLFLQEQVADSREVAVIPGYLLEHPSKQSVHVVTPLPMKTVVVGCAADAGSPMRSGVVVESGDQWTISSAFTLFANSPYGKGEQAAAYRWDSEWPKPDGDLYYRVGSGPWAQVSGRALVGADSVQSGEIEFYLDRAAIWSKIPAKYKTSSLLGLIPPVFWYKDTFPEFTVRLTGRRIEIKH